MSELFDITPFAYVGENVHYKELTKEEKDELKSAKAEPEVKKEALSLQERFEEQEDRIDELIRIAERNCFVFTVQEFVQYLYEHSR